MSLGLEASVDAPYPGLRPFRQDESLIFFGRDAQIDDVLARLKRHQFLGVVGSSGCGKSSLIRAGMLPALESGLMGELGSSWFIADMKPGDAPLTNLAKGLMQSGVLGDRWSNTPEGIALLTAALRRSDVSLVNLIQQIELPKYTNLLVLVDQFEEIFRFQQSDPNEHSQPSDPNEALAFVNLLLATGRDRSVPIYVVLTMRSDFLGPCASFPGLPEALNDAQYLCPRLTRDQLAEAIEGPAALFKGVVERALITQIVNDAGANSDQLPLVQHVLARMWNRVLGDSHETGAGRANRVLRLDDYFAIGGLLGNATQHESLTNGEPHTNSRAVDGSTQNALSRHADEAYFDLADDLVPESRIDGNKHQPSQRQLIAQKLFRCLAERGSSGQYVRSPVKVQDVASVAGCSVSKVIDVVEAFRRDDRSFLIPPVDEMLEAQSMLDIRHEVLIRQWQRFGGQDEQSDGADASQSWLAIEEQSQRRYRRLAEAAEAESKNRAGLLNDPELSFLNKWWHDFQPTEAWANRCVNDSFQQTQRFLARSRKAAEDERQRQQEAEGRLRTRRKLNFAMAFFAILGAVLAIALVGRFIVENSPYQRAKDLVNEMLQDPTGLRAKIERLEKSGLRDWAGTPLKYEIHSSTDLVRVLCARALLLPKDSTQAAPIFESLGQFPIGSTLDDLSSNNAAFQELCWFWAEFASKDAALNELRKLEVELQNLENKLRKVEEEHPTRNDPTIIRIRLGQRRAAVGMVLLRNQEWAAALHAVQVFDGDPEAMSQLFTHHRKGGVTVSQLISALRWIDKTEFSDSSQGKERTQPSAGTSATLQRANLPRVSLVMALGEYKFANIPSADQERIKKQLLHWFRDNKSSAIHGVTGWLLRRWDFEAEAETIEQEIAGPVPNVLDKEWFVLRVTSDENRTAYFTFVVFEPGKFKMGASKYAAYRKYEDLPYEVTLTHKFAVCDRELTRQQFNRSQQSPLKLDEVELNLPIVLNWHSGVGHCNQLTRQLFHDESHNCYVLRDGELVPDGDDFFTKTGFRLPTDAEWEYVCRSGTQTPYGFGSDETLLKEFGRDAIDRTDPVGQLRPNLRGVFDLHGNVGEWCSDRFVSNTDEQLPPATDPFRFRDVTERQNQRVVRGATFRYFAEASSAARRWNGTTSTYGIRLVLTLPEGEVKK